MRAHAVVIFHLLASAVWAGYQAAFTRPWPDTPFLFPLLLLALLPYWPGWPPQWRMSMTLRWAVALASMIGFGACAVSAARPIADKGYHNNFNSEAMLWMWLATAAIFVLAPLRRDAVAGGIGSKPQVILGTLWLIGFGISMTFSDVAEAYVTGIDGALHTPWGWLVAFLLIVFSFVALKAQRIAVLALAAIAILPALALPFMSLGGEASTALVLSWLCTFYLAALGITLIALSLRGDRGAPRLGATLMAVLVITRMADSGFSLLTKGMGFILVGIAFLAFNLFLGRLVKHTTSARA
jgi:hypothetical protein